MQVLRGTRGVMGSSFQFSCLAIYLAPDSWAKIALTFNVQMGERVVIQYISTTFQS